MSAKSLESKLKSKLKSGRKLFCAFVTLGYKSLGQTHSLIRLLDRLGTDIVELGIPFSDPLADGPVIQEASEYALRKGVHPQQAFDLVKQLRMEGVTVPIIFFSYFNPIIHRGISRTVKDLKQAGFDGVLCPDLPPDEHENLSKELLRSGLCQINLIAPTTSKTRMKKIIAKSHGFIYYVSRRGVTGVQKKLDEEIRAKVEEIKGLTKLPVLVGFGVSSEDQIREINRYADGVIMGSSLISAIKSGSGRNGSLERLLSRLVKTCHG
ncbi:MAG: tryptophan synthase subunit alpha [Candidatus Omnitrophica bacterium]|nr:tryptophan synthase subunit alpha [Candidatus Omnitrophota bacterium]